MVFVNAMAWVSFISNEDLSKLCVCFFLFMFYNWVNKNKMIICNTCDASNVEAIVFFSLYYVIKATYCYVLSADASLMK